MEVRRPVLIRPDHEAFGARGPVPPGHAQRGRVDERSVAPARAGVADPVGRERRVRAKTPLVAQAADARGWCVSREGGQAGGGQAAREQSRGVDLPVEAPVRAGPADRGADADELGGWAGDAEVMRSGIGREDGGGRKDRVPGAAGQDHQGDAAAAVPAGCGEVPVPSLEHRAGGVAAGRCVRCRPHGHTDPVVFADAQLPAPVAGLSRHQALGPGQPGGAEPQRRRLPGRGRLLPAQVGDQVGAAEKFLVPARKPAADRGSGGLGLQAEPHHLRGELGRRAADFDVHGAAWMRDARLRIANEFHAGFSVSSRHGCAGRAGPSAGPPAHRWSATMVPSRVTLAAMTDDRRCEVLRTATWTRSPPGRRRLMST